MALTETEYTFPLAEKLSSIHGELWPSTCNPRVAFLTRLGSAPGTFVAYGFDLGVEPERSCAYVVYGDLATERDRFRRANADPGVLLVDLTGGATSGDTIHELAQASNPPMTYPPAMALLSVLRSLRRLFTEEAARPSQDEAAAA
jgi:hypothetical protein